MVVVGALVVAATAWSTRYAPEELGTLCLSWFAFPYAWLLVLVLMVLMMMTRHWGVVMVCAVALGYSLPEALRVIDIPRGEEEMPAGCEGSAVRLLSYNVCNFLNTSNDFPEHRVDSLCAEILRSGADIVCIQEAPPEWMLKYQQVATPYKAVVGAYRHYRLYGNVGTLTNLEAEDILDPKVLGVDGNLPTAFLATDVTLRSGQKVRLFNCHLASIRLSQEQIDAVSSTERVDRERVSSWKTTYEHIMRAFGLRSVEVRELAKAVSASPYPVVICGDFNDTPVSYTFRTLGEVRPRGDSLESMSEARHSRRLGLARTYRGNLPPLRIDYIIKSGSVETWGYEEYDWAWSDHKGVGCWLGVE